MQWRARAANERKATKSTHLPIASSSQSEDWLTSDVVKIGGIAASTAYALQMSFDNRINVALDGQTAGQAELKRMKIAELNSANQWATVVTNSKFHDESLQDFLAANAGKSLVTLEGNWGVDPSSATNPQGRGKSWAIVHGSGVFAVVPEPATMLLLLSCAAGATVYGMRRWHRSARPRAANLMNQHRRVLVVVLVLAGSMSASYVPYVGTSKSGDAGWLGRKPATAAQPSAMPQPTMRPAVILRAKLPRP